MSITRDRGFIVVECDHCGDTFETETKDFDEALELLKRERWIYERKKNYCGSKCYVEATA